MYVCYADIPSMLLNATVWLFTSQRRTMLKSAVSCMECCGGFGIASTILRGPNKPAKKDTVRQQSPFNQSDTKYFDESNVASFRNYDTNFNYKPNLYCHVSNAVSQTTLPTVCPSGLLLNYNSFAGDDCKRDNSHAATVTQSVHKTDRHYNASLFESDILGSNDFHPSSIHILAKYPIPDCSTTNSPMHSVNTGQVLKAATTFNSGDNIMEIPIKSKPQQTVENSFIATTDCESCKLSYTVLVRNTVKTYNTKIFASLPQQTKYMVKQRVQDTSGATRIKLVLKSSHERLTIYLSSYTHIHRYMY